MLPHAHTHARPHFGSVRRLQRLAEEAAAPSASADALRRALSTLSEDGNAGD
jgi:hypothetical protein